MIKNNCKDSLLDSGQKRRAVMKGFQKHIFKGEKITVKEMLKATLNKSRFFSELVLKMQIAIDRCFEKVKVYGKSIEIH